MPGHFPGGSGYTLGPMRLHLLVLLIAFTVAGTTTPSAKGSTRQETARLSDSAIEDFLRTARVVRTRGAGKGVTGSIRATLTDGTLTHDAQIQIVDERKSEFRPARGPVEYNFRDSWRFNIAVYKIDRMLNLQMVPVSVQRTWNSTRGAFTWWLDDIQMDEGERLKRKLPPANALCWSDQVRLLRVLDQLIDNSDRNVGNILIAKDWRVWAIDHTRAFRTSTELRNPATLTGIDRQVLARLEALDFATLKADLNDYITDADIRAMLSRRDAMVAHFKQLGENALYDRHDLTGCVK
jgi:hypothetical protein